MSEQDLIQDGIKDIVSKLYVLRDSCTGIFHTEKTYSNGLWFEGATAILQQGVDQLNSGLEETGNAPDDADNEIYNGMKKALSKLYILRDSCRGISFAQNGDINLIWFQGAESILREAVEQLLETVELIEMEAEIQSSSVEEQYTDVEEEFGDEDTDDSDASDPASKTDADQPKKKVSVVK